MLHGKNSAYRNFVLEVIGRMEYANSKSPLKNRKIRFTFRLNRKNVKAEAEDMTLKGCEPPCAW